MNPSQARSIISHAVATTEPRWRQYVQRWMDIDIDTIFIQHGYEQQGFRMFRLTPLFQERGLLSIRALGSILSDNLSTVVYGPNYAKGLESSFYQELRQGARGRRGELFAEAVALLTTSEPASCGRLYWRLLWFMLQACAYLRRYHEASFEVYLLRAYGNFARQPQLSESEFLAIEEADWRRFLKRAKPWKHLKGIGENVFDFIIGDVEEARFARDSYKFDSANAHFLKVTGIASLILPFERDAVIDFLRGLGLPYTLREINKGIYTYCSLTEAENYGFCRSAAKCRECAVADVCGRHF